MNFMLRDRTGKTIESPSQIQRGLEFISLGPAVSSAFSRATARITSPWAALDLRMPKGDDRVFPIIAGAASNGRQSGISRKLEATR